MNKTWLGLFLAMVGVVWVLCTQSAQQSAHNANAVVGPLFQQTMEQTKAHLLHTAGEIRHNSAIELSLRRNSSHSLKQALKGRLSTGKVTRIAVFDGACGLVTQIGTVRERQIPCIKPKISASAYTVHPIQFYPADDSHYLGVSMLLASSDRSSYQVYVGVDLDKNWLQRQQPLFESTMERGLGLVHWPRDPEVGDTGFGVAQQFDGKHLTLIAAMGGAGQGFGLARIGGLFDRYGQKLRRLAPLVLWQWLAVASALIFGILAFTQKVRLTRRSRQGWIQLGRWMENYPKKVTTHRQRYQAPAKPEFPELEPLKVLHAEMVRKALQRIESVDSAVKMLEVEKEDLSRELHEMSMELAKTPTLFSLVQQVEDRGQSVVQELRTSVDTLNRYQEVFHGAVVPQIDQLAKLINTWRKGCREVTTRKFFRSLSERPSKNYENQLEEQFQSMADSCNLCINAIVNMSLHGKKALARSKMAADFIAHWTHLALPASQASVAESLHSSLEVATEMVKSQQRQLVLTVESPEAAQIAVDHLSIPQFILEAVFYHILMELVGVNYEGQAVNVVLKQSRHGDTVALEFTGRRSPQSSQEGTHMSLTKQLCRAIPINTRATVSADKRSLCVGISFRAAESSAHESVTRPPKRRAGAHSLPDSRTLGASPSF